MISKTPNSLTTRPLFADFFPECVTALVSTREQNFTVHQPHDPFTSGQKLSLTAASGLDAERICNIRQVHGDRILRCENPERPLPEADGLVTDVPGLGLAVRTADCLPIFLYDPKTGAVGLLHAGWRGTAARIAALAVARLRREYGTDPAHLRVAFGPCIRLQNYEVGPEFREYFPQEVMHIGGRDHFDLPLANLRQLRGAGVGRQNIFDCGICTFADPQYHSYRRDGAAAGRILSVMMRKE